MYESAAVISDDEMEKTGGTVEYFQNGRPKKPKRVRRKHFNYIPMMVEALENSPGQRATAAKVMEYVVKICPEVTSRQVGECKTNWSERIPEKNLMADKECWSLNI